MTRTARVTALAVLLSLFAPASARAALVTWTASGAVHAVSGELNSLGVYAGTPFTATIVYDSSTPMDPLDPSCACVRWTNSVRQVSFHAASYSIDLAAPTSNGIRAGVTLDVFASSPPLGVTSPAFLLTVSDPYGATRDPVTFMPIAPPLGPTSLTVLTLDFGSGAVLDALGLSLTHTVPEPAGTAALSSALLLAWPARRRRSP